MNANKQEHHTHGMSQSENERRQLPYWKRAHHDWRFWLALVLTITAMAIYVVSEDLSMRPGGRSQQRVPASLGE